MFMLDVDDDEVSMELPSIALWLRVSDIPDSADDAAPLRYA